MRVVGYLLEVACGTLQRPVLKVLEVLIDSVWEIICGRTVGADKMTSKSRHRVMESGTTTAGTTYASGEVRNGGGGSSYLSSTWSRCDARPAAHVLACALKRLA